MLKNVIVVCDYAYVEGGAAKVAIQTALALSNKTNLSIYFFAGCGEICDELSNSNVNTISLGMPDLLGNPSKLNAIRKGIYNRQAGEAFRKLLATLEINETVVHIHTWTKVLSSSIFKVCNELKVRTFLTVHDYFLVCPNGACYNYEKKEICELKPMSLKCLTCNCDARSYPQKIWRCLRQYQQNALIQQFSDLNYIFISNFQKKQILRRTNIDSNRSFFLRNIIDIKENFQVNCSDNKYYAFIGRVCKEKGIELYCKAISESGVKGIVIGDGPLLNEMKNQYPDILFTGWQSKQEIDNWLKKTRTLVFTSVLYEGSPLTIPEVQAHGVPCIVTSGNAGSDNIIPGVNGELVDVKLSSIINAIVRFRNDSYVELLSKNTHRLFASEKYEENYYVKSLLSIYEVLP